MGRKKKDYTAAIDSLNPDVDSDSEDMSLEEMGFGEDEAVDASKKDEPVDVDAPTSEAPSDVTDTAKTPEAASEVSQDATPDDPLDGEKATDGASEEAAKKPEAASSAEQSPSTDAATPADDATASTPSSDETVSMGDASYPAVQDMSDTSIKDADGKLVEGTETPLPPDAEPETVPEKAEDAAEDAEPAVGSPEGLEAAEKAAEEAPAPVDPSTLPGMAPCATVGAIEAVSGQPAPMTAIEGLGKDDTVPALGDVHEAAKPIEDALDGEVLGQLKDAGDKVSDAMLQLKALEQDLDSLPEGARAIAVKVMSMGLHFVSALESVFKRQ